MFGLCGFGVTCVGGFAFRCELGCGLVLDCGAGMVRLGFGLLISLCLAV